MASRSDGRRVLVVGATGFTGPYLIRALAQHGFTPVALEAQGPVDLRDRGAIEARVRDCAPDAVVHLAAISSVAHGDATELYGVNTVGTDHLLAALATHAPRLRCCVLASSANVYGNPVDDPVTEDTPPRPVNHYACSKLSMEFVARTWSDRLPIVIVRPFNYTGVGQSVQFLVPKLVRAFARRDEKIALGNLDVVRDFSDVRTVVDAYARLLTAGVPGTTYNLCSSVGRSLRGVVETLERLTGHTARLEVNPELVRRAELVRLVGSNRRIVDAIGPLAHADFEDTLGWMLNAAPDVA